MPPFQRYVTTFGPLLVFIAAMLWATDAPFRLHLTHELASSFIVLAEHCVDVVIALPILVIGWKELKGLTRREWVAILVIAVGGSALASIAFTQSFHYVNPSVAILLQKLQPLIAIALAALLLGEKLHRRFWLWAVVAIGGAYLISFPHFAPQLYPGEAFNPNTAGVLLALAAAVLWGASTVLGKFVLRRVTFKTLTAMRFVGAFVFLLVLNVTQHTIPSLGSITVTEWLFIGVIALTSGVFSLFLYYYGLKHTRASVATIAELGFPLAAVFVNAYFIASTPEPGAFLGLLGMQWLGTGVLLLALYQLTRFNADSLLETRS
jgi:drug/metabolite transporter (DMT)-like permease